MSDWSKEAQAAGFPDWQTLANHFGRLQNQWFEKTFPGAIGKLVALELSKMETYDQIRKRINSQ